MRFPKMSFYYRVILLHNNEFSGLSAAMTGCAVKYLQSYHISGKIAT